MKTTITSEPTTNVKVNLEPEEAPTLYDKVTPKGKGKLDMVIAFDTTGSMAAYIDDVRHQVAEMIPRIFKDNEDLRLGIVAFGDYCDMVKRDTFGDAYQCIPLTDNENDIIKFVKESKDTFGGDGDEFYELVLKKIIDESPWREDSSKAILLIADADPHEVGYTYRDYVTGNQIDWRIEAKKAADMKIKIDTVSICGNPWYKELSAMTNGISVPFKSSGKTGTMIETATTARSAMAFAESASGCEDATTRVYCRERVHGLKGKLSRMFSACEDAELNDVYMNHIQKKSMIKMSNLQDRCRGTLVGGAVGDALGYEVEFMSLSAIRKRFGEKGISDYVLDRSGLAELSDDTQMSLFTAEGLLCGIADGKVCDRDLLPYITEAYEYWYYTQSRPSLKMSGSWLTHVAALWSRRAPGNTCMSALRCISMPNPAPVINNSKGCGGVMRVAPIGIFSAAHPRVLDLEHAGYLAGYAADITHKHPLSTFSSMALAMIVADCLTYDNVDREKFRFIVIDRIFRWLGLYFNEDKYLSALQALVQKSLDLAVSDKTDADAIRELGEGWVAEETLAIAVFSVMRYIDDFDKCIRCAVNHDGDSDSTGAVTGNIIGAILGYSSIPQKYLTNLELHDVLLSAADDLGGFSSPEQMKERYVNHKPFGANPSELL